MKTFSRNISAALMVCAALVTFTSCNDDDSDSKTFKSDLIGSYKPYFPTEGSSVGALSISATWADPENIPTIDLSAMGLGEASLADVLPLASQLLGAAYGGGLVQFDFKNDGTIAFEYRKMEDFLSAQFAETTTLFPGTDPQSAAIGSALGYYSKGGKVYFSVQRWLVTQLGTQATGQDLCPIIDGLLEANPGINMISDAEKYAIPLKYSFDNNGLLTIAMDKAMLAPYLPVLQATVLPLLPAQIQIADGVSLSTAELVPALIDGLFVQSETLVISLTLQKI